MDPKREVEPRPTRGEGSLNFSKELQYLLQIARKYLRENMDGIEGNSVSEEESNSTDAYITESDSETDQPSVSTERNKRKSRTIVNAHRFTHPKKTLRNTHQPNKSMTIVD